MNPREPFGAFLALARNRSGLTQAEVGRKLGFPSGGQFCSNWERGVSMPPIDCVSTLARIYGLEAPKLLAEWRKVRVREADQEQRELRKALGRLA